VRESSQRRDVTYPCATTASAWISNDAHMAPASLSDLFAGRARPRAYIASPLGFSEAGRVYYAERYLPALREHVEPVDPWTLSQAHEFATAREAGREHAFGLEVGARNADAITGSQLLIAQLDGQEVDAGTASEVGYAAALGLPCLALRSDLRSSGEPGMSVNLQLESFVVLSGGFVVRSLDELLARLAELRGQPAA
jgi:nucleoside 2-deoxyribosyltransferase